MRRARERDLEHVHGPGKTPLISKLLTSLQGPFATDLLVALHRTRADADAERLRRRLWPGGGMTRPVTVPLPRDIASTIPVRIGQDRVDAARSGRTRRASP